MRFVSKSERKRERERGVLRFNEEEERELFTQKNKRKKDHKFVKNTKKV